MRRSEWNNNEESSNRWQLNIYVAAESRSRSIAFNNFPAGFSSLVSQFFNTDVTLPFISFDFWYQRVTRLCAERNQRTGKQSDSSSFLRGAICHSYIFRDALRDLSEDQRRAWPAQWPERETENKGTFGLLVSADRSNRNKSAARRTGSRIAWMRHGVHARRRRVHVKPGRGGRRCLFRGDLWNCEHNPGPVQAAGRNVSPDVFHMPSAVPQRRRSVQLSNPLSGRWPSQSHLQRDLAVDQPACCRAPASSGASQGKSLFPTYIRR